MSCVRFGSSQQLSDYTFHMAKPKHLLALAIVLIGGLFPFCAMQNLPTESHTSGSSGAIHSQLNYGFPFVAFTVCKTEFLFQPRKSEFDYPDWHLTGLFLNLSLIGVFCVGLFSSTRSLFAIRSMRFHLSHILQLIFAISVCLAIHRDWLKLYGWMIGIFNLEFDIGIIFHRPLWRTIVVYFNLFALSFAAAAWLASICSAIRSSVSRNVG